MSNQLAGTFEGETFCRKQIGVDPTTHGYRILIRAPLTQEKSQGGLYIPEEVRIADQYRENIGLVLSIGPKCFTGEAFENEGARCVVGDWVYYSSYEKEKYQLNGFLCYYINDDRIHSTVSVEDLELLLKGRF